jgi:hypothetical protein
LTTYDKVSLDGNNVVVTYHETQEIADAGSPFIVVSRDFKEDKIFFARLTNQATGCFETTAIT